MSTETPARPWEPTGADSDLDTLLEGYYWCGRAWEAWQYKTMTEDDFEEAGECELPADLRAWRDAAVAAARASLTAEFAEQIRMAEVIATSAERQAVIRTMFAPLLAADTTKGEH